MEISENVKDLEQIFKNNVKLDNGKNNYKTVIVFLINMNSQKEVDFAKKVDKLNDTVLIYGYFIKSKLNLKARRSNVKFNQKFDLSSGYENIIVALNKLYTDRYISN